MENKSTSLGRGVYKKEKKTKFRPKKSNQIRICLYTLEACNLENGMELELVRPNNPAPSD